MKHSGISRNVLPCAAGICLCASAAAGAPQWIRVYAGAEHAARADSLDKIFRAHAYQSAPRKCSWIGTAVGTVPVLITAPHATSPRREGKQRYFDKGTGALAVLLHEIAGASILHTMWESPCDPNDSDSCAFKDSLAAILRTVKPRIVIDLHSSSAERPYDVDFGTMHGKAIAAFPESLDSLAQILSIHGLTSQSRDFFSASHQRTITRFAASSGFPAIQLEINTTWLRPGGSDINRHRFIQLVNALTCYITSFSTGKSISKTSGQMPQQSGTTPSRPLPASDGGPADSLGESTP